MSLKNWQSFREPEDDIFPGYLTLQGVADLRVTDFPFLWSVNGARVMERSSIKSGGGCG